MGSSKKVDMGRVLDRNGETEDKRFGLAVEKSKIGTGCTGHSAHVLQDLRQAVHCNIQASH